MRSKEATNIYFIVFGFIRPWLEPRSTTLPLHHWWGSVL